MEDALILETTFLIELERELARGGDRPAQRFLASHAAHRLFINPHRCRWVGGRNQLGNTDARSGTRRATATAI